MEATTTKRADPRARQYNPGVSGQIRHNRPDRAYLLANPMDNLHGLAMHLDSGWHKVNGGKDGDKERVHSGKTEANGDVTFEGQVLIWIEKDEYDFRMQRRQELIDAREAKIRAPGGIDSVIDVDGNPAQNM